MSKIILEFDGDEEFNQAHTALHGLDWKLVVESIDQWLRNALKYGHEYTTPNEALEAARAHLHTEMARKNIDIF